MTPAEVDALPLRARVQILIGEELRGTLERDLRDVPPLPVMELCYRVAARVEQDTRQRIEQLRAEVQGELFQDMRYAAGATRGWSEYADQIKGIDRVLNLLARGENSR